jgi:hypothetical protein
VFWFPKARKEHIGKFKEHWFGPYKIQYCLPNNITFLVTIDKFDPNPILVNINKLKPYRFQDPTTYKGLESTVKRGRDTTNTEIGVNTAIPKNYNLLPFRLGCRWCPSLDQAQIVVECGLATILQVLDWFP